MILVQTKSDEQRLISNQNMTNLKDNDLLNIEIVKLKENTKEIVKLKENIKEITEKNLNLHQKLNSSKKE